jgi:hypothetical protein
MIFKRLIEGRGLTVKGRNPIYGLRYCISQAGLPPLIGQTSPLFRSDLPSLSQTLHLWVETPASLSQDCRISELRLPPLIGQTSPLLDQISLL